MIDTRVMRSADVASDHFLVRSTIRLNLKRAPLRGKIRKKFDTQKLQDNYKCRRFSMQLKNRFQLLEVEEPTDIAEEVERKSEIMDEP